MKKGAVLAFSGGLDTRWCVPYLVDRGYEVATVTVDVGGLQEDAANEFASLSKELGAFKHLHIDAKQAFFDRVLKHLIAGNVMRGGIYPLCVGAERSIQAAISAETAQKLGFDAVAHGCTAAGNDQFRFEVSLKSQAPGLEIIAPVRDTTPTRAEQVAFLESKGLPIPPHGADYSVNEGLWGVTIGGKETKGTSDSIPESQWIRTKGAFEGSKDPRHLSIGFDQGLPSGVDGVKMGPVEAIQAIDKIAGAYGIGRGIHLGETILGIKGRVAFEAPAATTIITAHRELEKLVLTKKQASIKDLIAQQYGEMVHEGLYVDPSCRDIEAFFSSTQVRVTGEVNLLLRSGSLFVEGVQSPYSLHAASGSVYGEAATDWSAEDARGFGNIYGLSSILHARADAK